MFLAADTWGKAQGLIRSWLNVYSLQESFPLIEEDRQYVKSYEHVWEHSNGIAAFLRDVSIIYRGPDYHTLKLGLELWLGVI